MASMASLSRSTLREQALLRLRDAILTGELPPGSHLNEVELSGQLGISRGTIREALRALEQAGMAEQVDRGRLLVRTLSVREINELYDVRTVLERHAAELIMASPDKAQLLSRLREALPAGGDHDEPFAQAMDRDLAFHETLCTLSGNKLLVEMWHGLENHVRIVAASCGVRTKQPIMTRESHEPLIDAMEHADQAEVGQAIAAHMRSAVDFWVSRLG